MAREIFGAAGYRVEYEVVNWARCVEDARAGRFSAIIGAIRADAPDFIFPSVPLGTSGDAYASRTADRFHFDGVKSLDGRVLGVIRSYAFSGPIGAYIAAHGNDGSRVEYVSGNGALSKNLAKLLAGRVDVVLDDYKVLRHAVAEGHLEDRISVQPGLNVTPVYLAFSPSGQAAELAHIFDVGMSKLRASGRLAQIMATYSIADDS